MLEAETIRRLVRNGFYRVTQQTVSADLHSSATAVPRIVTRLAMLGYSVPVDAICDKPLSDVVRSVIGAGRCTSTMLLAQALRDEQSRR